MTKQTRVGLVYVGDGAMSTGAFHEGINFAAVQRLPLVVVSENNGYAYSTPMRLQTAVKSLADRAVAYGIPGVTADGNDVLEVYQVTRTAVDRARAGEGVTLIELMTYRRKGHAEHDNQSYVPPGEIEAWERNDPIDRYVRRLTDNSWASPDELREIDGRIEKELDAAIALCENEPLPDPSTALSDVYQEFRVEPHWYRGLDA